MKKLQLLAFLFLLAHCLMAQSIVTTCFQPAAATGKDASMDSRVPNNNYANYLDFDVIAWTYQGQPLIQRAAIEFTDLTTIPSNATVTNATLYLYNNPNSINSPNHSQLSGSNAAVLTRITAPWSESTLTWNTQPTTTSTGSSSLTDAVPVHASNSPNEDYVIDVTDMTQFMVANPSTNYGMMLQLVTEQYYRCLIFASSDNADSTLHPKLCVTYTVPDSNAHCFQPGANVGKDATIDSRVPNNNYGNYLDFDALAWTVSGQPVTLRSAIEFTDLATIPNTAIVTNAALYLYNNPSSINSPGHSQLSGSNAAVLTRITTPWNESTITWNTQPTTTSTSSSSLTDAVPVHASNSPNEDYVIDVTDMTQFMVTNPSTNYGFMLQLETEQFYRALIFASSDHADSTLHPKLCVTYIVPIDTLDCIQPDSGKGFDAVIESLNPNTNYGSYPDCDVFGWTISGQIDTMRTALMFTDLANIAPGTPVTSAILHLYNNPVSFNCNGEHSQLSGSNAAVLTRITAPWGETTITWNNQPTTTSTSSTSLVDAVPVHASNTIHEDYAIDVTDMVQFMVNNPATNYGFMMQLLDEAYYRALIFGSSDHPNAALHPELCVTVDSLVAVKPFQDISEHFQVYPNPASSGFTVRIADTGFEGTLELWNVEGQRIWQQVITESEVHVDRGNLSAGIYYLRMIDGHSATFAKKLVIQ